MVERFDGDRPTRVLIDTGPDMRAQLIDAGVDEVHGVAYTHAHADHVHGIDDLRTFWMSSGNRIPIFSDDNTQRRLNEAFGYCFVSPEGSPYPPFLERRPITPGDAISINGPGGEIELMPFHQIHGDIRSLGFRVGKLAYSCDFNDLPPGAVEHLDDLDVWVVDGLRRRPHPSHCSVDEALGWITRIGPRRAILTHMTNDLDYQTLSDELPEYVEPAYDGMRIDVRI